MGLREKIYLLVKSIIKRGEKTLSIFKNDYPPRGEGEKGGGKIIKPQGFYCSAVSRAYTIIVMFVSTLLQLFTPHYLGTSNKTKTSDI